MFLLGDEPVIVLFLAVFIILLYFGWRSTYVPDNYPPGLIATTSSLHHPASGSSLARDLVVPVRGNLLNRLVDQITNSAAAGNNFNSTGLRRRRHHHHHHHIHPRGISRVHNNSVEEVEYNDQGNILMTHVLSWASNESSISTGTNTETAEEGRLRRHTEYLIGEIQNEGPQAIIREMDRDLPPEDDGTDAVNRSGSTGPEEVQNCANENSENVNKQAGEGGNAPPAAAPVEEINEDPWKIKIKYLNDDMKVVEATPSQTLGDFKRRNFIAEIAANKLVRLVFNGKVLQPESTSLRSCGLFENCVVHCLVQNNMEGSGGGQATAAAGGRNTTGSSSSLGSRAGMLATVEPIRRDVIGENAEGGAGGLLLGPSTESGDGGVESGYRLRPSLDWFFVILNRFYNWRFFTELLLFIFTIITIYLRIRYADYFTSTATIGLILVSVMVLGISITLNVM